MSPVKLTSSVVLRANESNLEALGRNLSEIAIVFALEFEIRVTVHFFHTLSRNSTDL